MRILVSFSLRNAISMFLYCALVLKTYRVNSKKILQVMFTIPRLAIVAGLLIFPDGPLCLDRGELSEMFRPFRSLLLKIRELLWTLTRPELCALERALCSSEEPDPESADFNEGLKAQEESEANHHYYPQPSHSPGIYGIIDSRPEIRNGQHSIQDYLDQFCKDFPQCRELISDLCNSTNVDCAAEPNNEMSVSQYSMNLSQSTGGGDVPPVSRHQLIVNAITANNPNSTGTSSYIEEAETEGSCSSSGSIGTHTIKGFCCSGQETYQRNEGTEEPYESHTSNCPKPSKTIKRSIKTSPTFSSEEEVSGSTGGIQPGSLYSEYTCDEDTTMTHASSSSSQDSGLCSLAEKESIKEPSPPSTVLPGITPSYKYSTTPVASVAYPEPTDRNYQSSLITHPRNSSSYSSGDCVNKRLLHVPGRTDDHHRNPHRSSSRSHGTPACPGGYCGSSKPGTSPG